MRGTTKADWRDMGILISPRCNTSREDEKMSRAKMLKLIPSPTFRVTDLAEIEPRLSR